MQDTEFTAQDERLVVRYLLGQLKGVKKTRFEERYFTDEAFFEYVCAVEDILIDQFLQERLSWWKRRRFKKVYEAVPERRKRLAAAQEMMQAFPSERRRPFLRSAGQLLRAQSRKTQMAVAVAVIAVAIAPWVILAILQGGNRLVSHNPEGQRIAETTQPGVSEPSTIASFFLEPGTFRGRSEGTGRLAIPKTAGLIKVRLALPGQPSDKEYRAKMLEAGGIEILREHVPAVSNGSGGPSVTVWVPAELLMQTDYVFILEGKSGLGGFSEIASYEFAIARK